MDPDRKTRIGGYVGKYDDCEKVKRAVLSLCAIVDCEGSMDHELAAFNMPCVAQNTNTNTNIQKYKSSKVQIQNFKIINKDIKNTNTIYPWITSSQPSTCPVQRQKPLQEGCDDLKKDTHVYTNHEVLNIF